MTRIKVVGRESLAILSSWRNDVLSLPIQCYSNRMFWTKSSSGLLNYFLFRDRESDESLSRRLPRSIRTASQVDAASVALFQETLQGLFGLLTGTMMPAAPNAGHEAVGQFVKQHPLATIITTNYDGCVDEALIKGSVPFATHVSEVSSADGQSLDLIKIHGSINRSYCDSCHEVRELDLVQLKEGYEKDTISYVVVGICKNCGGQRKPLLIPPMGLKFVMFPNLIRLWNLARQRIEEAYYLIVVGFSFSKADSYINKIIERSMSFNDKQVILVCDPNHRLVPSLRSRYSARIEGFGVKRVLAAVGSGHELLPKILTSLTSVQHDTAQATEYSKEAV